MKDKLHNNLSRLFSDPGGTAGDHIPEPTDLYPGNPLPFKITYGVQTLFNVDDYNAIHEEEWDEVFEMADETDLEDD